MSTPHCSFVIYLFRDFDSLPLLVQDFRAFFQKFPLHYELICVIDTKHDENFWNSLKKNAPANESWQILHNSHKKGRAQSLLEGLKNARAEFIVFPSVTMATPLGDLFKILQHLMSDPSLMACWGERYSKKTETITRAQGKILKLENLFNKILKEKNPHGSLDPLCEIGALRKSAWIQIQGAVDSKKKKGWYFANHCQKILRDHGASQSYLYVHDSGKRPKDFSLWRARWELLGQSLFETL